MRINLGRVIAEAENANISLSARRVAQPARVIPLIY
jgi:hypothetical protein